MHSFYLADVAGPFYSTDKPFRNWSSVPYYQLDSDRAPYVDMQQLIRGVARACTYLEQIHAQGYNGIVFDNLAHLVTFAAAPDSIYSPSDAEYQRAIMYREAVAPLFARALLFGMRVFVTADLQWSTPAIRRYVGRMTPDNPRLQDVNRWALEELFTSLPAVSGLVIRCGEAGGAHDQQLYQGHMIYTSVAKLRVLINTLLPICEHMERYLIVRTWSVGIGEAGDLIWSKERYQELFGAYTSEHLLTSIKHGPTDFFRFLPHNPTLGLPGPRQIIELQNRREYELFGMIPSSVVLLHRQVFQHASTNPQYAGIWAWNSTGGWGGGAAALAGQGWSLWTELGSAATAKLMLHHDADVDAFVYHWCAERFGEGLGHAIADLYLESDKILEAGWYLGPLTNRVATVGTMYLPTLLWVWWMRPTASLLIWIYLSTAVGDVTAALQSGGQAVARAEMHAQRITHLATPHHSVAHAARYFADMLAVAHAIQSVMLRLGSAAAHKNRVAWCAEAEHASTLLRRLGVHGQRWGQDRQYPPLELGEMRSFLLGLVRDPNLQWRRARLAQRIVMQLRGKQQFRQRTYLAGSVGTLLLTGLFVRKSRRSLGVLGLMASSMFVPALRRRVVRATFPWLSQRLYLLPSIFFETGPALTEWA